MNFNFSSMTESLQKAQASATEGLQKAQASAKAVAARVEQLDTTALENQMMGSISKAVQRVESGISGEAPTPTKGPQTSDGAAAATPKRRTLESLSRDELMQVARRELDAGKRLRAEATSAAAVRAAAAGLVRGAGFGVWAREPASLVGHRGYLLSFSSADAADPSRTCPLRLAYLCPRSRRCGAWPRARWIDGGGAERR